MITPFCVKIVEKLTNKSKKCYYPLPSDLKDITDFYLKGYHKKLACALPHIRDIDDKFIKTLTESRLLFMGEELKTLPPITLGADPEFILKDKLSGEVVLFSSDFVQENWGLNMSEATLGADYGLLEIRPAEEKEVDDLMRNIEQILNIFDTTYSKIEIKEAEAIVFDHKKERIRSLIENEETDFGVNMQKADIVDIAGISLDDVASVSNVSLSAYDEPILYPQRTDLLTAGGHIHIGGTFVRMLSLSQLKTLIRKIDETVRDKCLSTETAAGALRREVYGNPGEFRIKSYGVEYRTPSNSIFWPKNRKVLKEVLEDIYNITTTFFI